MMTIAPHDLKTSLGVKCLRHRRVLMDAINTLTVSTNQSIQKTLPEDARTLTHLLNTRTMIAWIILSLQMQTFAVALLFLYPTYSRLTLKLAASAITVASWCLLLNASLIYFEVCNDREGFDRQMTSLHKTSRTWRVLLVMAFVWTVSMSCLYHPSTIKAKNDMFHVAMCVVMANTP